MNWSIPGTVLTGRREDARFVEQQFTAMFLGGGIMLSQVSAITGLEPYTVQNWVKREFLPPPEHKRYNMNQLCRIITINMLKNALPMEKITGLIAYVNGELDDTSDDLIDDAKLYFLFVKLAAQTTVGHSVDGWDKAMQEVMAEYAEPCPGAKERVEKALGIMLTAWSASRLRDRAEAMLSELF